MRSIAFFIFYFPACLLFADQPKGPPVATYSIVAVDRETGEIGVAVQSKFVCVGAVVPYAKAGVGAVATQAWANTSYGPLGLMLMESGANPEQCIEVFKKGDGNIESRQVGIVAANGEVATFTGSACSDWAGGQSGDGYVVQGNILANETVVPAMAEAFEAAEGVLAERLIAALEAGEEAGGDKRGRLSAALLVVRENWGYSGGNDRFRDIRVDEHETPIVELRRIYEAHRKVFPRPDAFLISAPEDTGATEETDAPVKPTAELENATEETEVPVEE